jgi:phasin family protein
MKSQKAAARINQLHQDNLAAALRMAQLTVEASQKLIAVQLDMARHAVEAGSRNLKALSQSAAAQDAAALQAALAGQAVEQALEYSESLYAVSTELQDQFSRLVEARVDACAADIPAAMEQLLEANPRGAEAASAAVRGALQAGQAAFDNLLSATRQVSEVARSGVKAVSQATSAAVKSHKS